MGTVSGFERNNAKEEEKCLRKNRKNLQQNSRVGLTLSLPLGRKQSIKLAAHTGAFTSIGADFDIATVTYQILW